MGNTELLNFNVMCFIQQTRSSIKIETLLGFLKGKSIFGLCECGLECHYLSLILCPLLPQLSEGEVLADRIHWLMGDEGKVWDESADTQGEMAGTATQEFGFQALCCLLLVG